MLVNRALYPCLCRDCELTKAACKTWSICMSWVGQERASKSRMNLPCFKVIFLPLFGPKVDLGQCFRSWQVLFLHMTPPTVPRPSKIAGQSKWVTVKLTAKFYTFPRMECIKWTWATKLIEHGAGITWIRWEAHRGASSGRPAIGPRFSTLEPYKPSVGLFETPCNERAPSPARICLHIYVCNSTVLKLRRCKDENFG